MGGLDSVERAHYVGIVPIHGGRLSKNEPGEGKLDDGEWR